METDERTTPVWFYSVIIIILSAISIAIWYLYGDTELALRKYTSWTARFSFLIFMAAFLASTLAIRWPSNWSGWLLANRRDVGLCFALAHFVHLGALIALHVERQAFPAPVTLVFGGVAYIFVALMALTSTDWAQQKLGPMWHRLHTFGGYYIWGVFAYTLLGGIFIHPASLIMFSIAIGGLAAKIMTKRQLSVA